MKIKQNWSKTPIHRKIGDLLLYLSGIYCTAIMMTDWTHDTKEWNLYFAGVIVGAYKAGVKFLLDDDLNINVPNYSKSNSEPPAIPAKPIKKDIEI